VGRKIEDDKQKMFASPGVHEIGEMKKKYFENKKKRS